VPSSRSASTFVVLLARFADTRNSETTQGMIRNVNYTANNVNVKIMPSIYANGIRNTASYCHLLNLLCGINGFTSAA
jgi:hypothetical protein